MQLILYQFIASALLLQSVVAPQPPAAFLSTLPAYHLTINAPNYQVDSHIQVRRAPAGDNTIGQVDLTIDVTVNIVRAGEPHSFTVRAECNGVKFLLATSSLLFDSYPDAPNTCLREFIGDINTNMGFQVVTSPLILEMAGDGSQLTFDYQGNQVPFSLV